MQMEEDSVRTVIKNLVVEENEYEDRQKNLEGLHKVLVVLEKLRIVREDKVSQEESSSSIDTLLEESVEKLRQILFAHTDSSPYYDVDFFKWATDIESDIRAQNPLLLTFESGCEEDAEEVHSRMSRSGRLSTRESSVSSRGGSTLLHILKSNGKLRQKPQDDSSTGGKEDRFFFFTTVAWAFAVVGMMITIGFLTADFLVAQKNVAVQVVRSDPQPMELPAVTICSEWPNIPSFENFPTEKHPGLPLFGISQYVRSTRSLTATAKSLIYPDTLDRSEVSPIDDVLVTENAPTFRAASRGFNVTREQESLHDIRQAGRFHSQNGMATRGLYCFRVGHRIRETLEPLHRNTSGNVFLPALQVTFFQSRMWDACRSGRFRRDPRLDVLFSTELFSYASELEATGVLDFRSYNHSVLKESRLQLGIAHSVDFFCNVYFFSGFFYPSLDNADISYHYDPDYSDRWRRVGSGPYYSSYSWEADADVLIGPDARALQNDTYVFSGISIYAEEASKVDESGIVSPRSIVSVIDSKQNSILTFRRVNIEGKNVFKVKEGSGTRSTGSLKLVDTYRVSIDFSTFETETILTAPTMSWPEFLTDVFEFVGLFTGICIFTLIVAPASSLV